MKKILIVEDNAVNLRLVKMTLRNRPFEFIEAVNGEEAVSLAAERLPDLIILDIQIPKMDGYEVARHLKANERLRNIPVIALTAHAMKGDEQRALQAGCDHYVSKPLETIAFRQLVESLLNP